MVEVEGYQGTIARLLQQINGHERDILDVPLAPIVEVFVATLLERREMLSLDQISEFLLIAAVLIEMKSTRLLPGPDEVDTDEELVGLEARDLLLARLLECRAYAGAADAFVLLSELAQLSV
ncbi:MAG: segregation/condensation protein A, partial [Actinomycetes bacterium]